MRQCVYKPMSHKVQKQIHQAKRKRDPFGCKAWALIVSVVNKLAFYSGCFFTIGFYDFWRDNFNGCLFCMHIRIRLKWPTIWMCMSRLLTIYGVFSYLVNIFFHHIWWLIFFFTWISSVFLTSPSLVSMTWSICIKEFTIWFSD